MVRIRTHANPLQVPEPEPVQPLERFGREAPLLLEIGFGRGDFLLGLARAHADHDVLGLEIRRALVEHVEERRGALGLDNLRVVLADASRHLALVVAPQSVAAAFVLFPDPWRKSRHLKRRVLRRPLLDALAVALAPGGRIEVQTDSAELAAEAASEIVAHPELVLVTAPDAPAAELIPDCGSRRSRMHRERGARIHKLRAGLATAPPPAPGPDGRDLYLGFEPVLPRIT
jgi:tRNA (guanine-N7-)-methyltransferase